MDARTHFQAARTAAGMIAAHGIARHSQPSGKSGGRANRARRRRAMIVAMAGAAMLVPAALAAASPTAHHRTARHHGAPFGTIVNWRTASHTATVARPSGQLFAVHSARPMRVGTRVAIRHLKRLQNGTYTGTLVPEGRAHRMRVRGVVVAELGARGFALGARGATFVIRLRVHNSGMRDAALTADPTVGSTVVADVVVGGGGDLTEVDVRNLTPASATAPVEIGGTLVGIDTTSRTIVIADSEDGTTTNYTIDIPAAVDLSVLVLGQEIHVLATPNGDGTYTLAVAPVPLQIEGTISWIDTTAKTITLTNTNGGVTLTFVVDVPSSVNITGFSIGDEVEFEVIQNADGTYSLVQGSDNANADQADGQDGQSGTQGGSGFGVWTPPGGGSDHGGSGSDHGGSGGGGD